MEQSQTRQQSPNWDAHSAVAEQLLSGQMIPGFPFDEGVPADPTATYEIVLRNGEKLKAHVDLSRQYAAEGRQWRANGDTYNRYVVACWRRLKD